MISLRRKTGLKAVPRGKVGMTDVRKNFFR
jgi:hypothetical protein